MSNQHLIPGERHHWWPKSLSKFWTDNKGMINRVDAEGNISRSNPTGTGRISDGHNIRLNSPWDTRFEGYFDRPDRNFPHIVNWLESLVNLHRNSDVSSDEVYCAHSYNEDELQPLCEGLISLAIRSPNFRQGILRRIERVRSSLPKDEHKTLIAANLMQTYSLVTQNALGRGKFLILFSDSSEFIYGDGIYHNLNSCGQYLSNCRILAPLTPRMAVLYVTPMEYFTEPRIVTRRADEATVSTVNETVQVYSKECLFYRFDKPNLGEHFLQREHLVYSGGDPVETLIADIPGIRTRGRFFTVLR